MTTYVRFEPTPPQAVEFLKKYILNKIVYDLGCGDGIFMIAMKLYASQVVGIEIRPELVKEAKGNGLSIIQNNFIKENLSKAEVIYCFLNFMGMYAIDKKLEEENWHGTLISNFYPLPNKKPNEVIDVKLDDARFPFLIYNL